MFRIILSYIVLSIFVCHGQLSAQGSQAMIKGQISDDSGATVPGIIAMLEGTSKGGVSNLDGRYEIKNIKPGTYQLVISGIGFVKQKKQITLETGQTVNIDISLVEDTKELNEVVVRGKSEATRVREQSYAVSSIDARPLQNLNLDLNKVLSKVSGVRIRETGGLGSHFSFSLNGFNGNQVRFFLDGVPMENFGSSLSLNNLPINIADRIEIYKGVVPVRLGSDALGGAVNIVTNQNIGTYLDASYTYGSFNTHRTSINGGYTNSENGFTVRANLFQNYSDNSYKVLVNKKEGSVLLKELEEVERFHDGYDSKSAIVDIGLVNRPFADQLLVGVILSKSEKEQQTGATMEKVYGQRKQISSTLMPTVRYKKKDLLVDGLELNGFASYNFGYTQTVDTTSRTYFWDGTYVEKADPTSGELNKTRYKFTDNSFITRGNLSYLLNENHSFVANYTFNSVDRQGNDTANPLEISNREPKLVSKSVIGVGYKFDWDETVTVSLFAKNYRLGGETYYTENIYDDPARVKRNLKQSQLGYGTAFSYRVPDTDLQIKGSIENAYRMPEALELFGDGANVRGNVKLKPEQSMNYNIGAMYELNVNQHHLINVEANYLQRNVGQFIRPAVGSSNPTSSFVNEDAVEVFGLEGNIGYSYKSLLRLNANITYQVQRNATEMVNGKTNPLYHKQIPNQPYLFANANAMVNFNKVVFPHDKLGISYGASFYEQYFLFWESYGSSDSKKTIPRQFTHNVDINYSLQDGRYNLSLSCDNISDAVLFDNFKLQKPGRAFYLKIRYFFKSNN